MFGFKGKSPKTKAKRGSAIKHIYLKPTENTKYPSDSDKAALLKEGLRLFDEWRETEKPKIIAVSKFGLFLGGESSFSKDGSYSIYFELFALYDEK